MPRGSGVEWALSLWFQRGFKRASGFIGGHTRRVMRVVVPSLSA